MDFRTLAIPDMTRVEDATLEAYSLGCLSAADELKLFDYLSKHGPKRPADIARDLKLSPHAMDPICRVLVASGFMRLQSDGFVNTDESEAYFVSSSPLYRGLSLARWRDDRAHKRITASAKDTGSLFGWDGRTFTEQWEKGEITPEDARVFTRMMHSLILAPSIMAVRSGAFSGRGHVVDVGGGSGAFAMALKAHQPATRVTCFDLPAVCEVARENFARHGFGDEIETFGSNFFSDKWPPDADTMYLSNILHDWPASKCDEILANIAKHLPSGGKLYIHEVLLAEDGVSPKMAVVFHLLMFLNHRAQQFKLSELAEMLERAGFEEPKFESQFSYYSLISATRR